MVAMLNMVAEEAAMSRLHVMYVKPLMMRPADATGTVARAVAPAIGQDRVQERSELPLAAARIKINKFCTNG